VRTKSVTFQYPQLSYPLGEENVILNTIRVRSPYGTLSRGAITVTVDGRFILQPQRVHWFYENNPRSYRGITVSMEATDDRPIWDGEILTVTYATAP
jgi:hypothetical protein